MIALVDANAYYAAAECVYNPALRGQGIAILSNNDGCVVACNQIAQQAGVKKFKPYFEMKHLANRVKFLSSNYELYGHISDQMMKVIGEHAPEQFIYSIDESFLNFKGCKDVDFRQTAMTLRRQVWRRCRIPVSVGIGPTLTLAKCASHASKRLGYNGICVLDSLNITRNVLSQMDVGDVWGIGARLKARLNTEMRIFKAEQLAALSPSLARKSYSVDVERIVHELNGVSTRVWDESARADKQQIFSTRSVGQRIENVEELKEALISHVAIAAAKLRKQKSAAGTLMLFAHSSSFDKSDGGIGFRHIHHFKTRCDDTLVMSQIASRVADLKFQSRLRYYKIGVGLLDLSSQTNAQIDMFDEQLGNPQLMSILDSLNEKYGRDTLFCASQGIKPRWAMRREMLSPAYISDWRDIPIIKT
ncbi:Y-family DNA polymerase [Enterovibrio norvegicus]|uniref:Y-family DNA polymerase n=1 Tax=Enterovibrio norvegicus TaxID=188144 RepID=UPI000C858CAB|nr:Y-family DNA polymerase [Enterovibrio norvegicus]PMH64509.1 hypothetical protein BCU62_15760 [Enterovibrio norvegicus]